VPRAVLRPGSADDVAPTIRWAAQQGLRFTAQGRRHSTFGRSLVHDGVVADMSTLRAVGTVDGDRVVVEAGATWSDVLGVTLARGMTPPVLTDYLDLSVGGTLVVGGVGGSTSTFGVQSDNVAEMEVVTGSGRMIVCSPGTNAELFDAVRAGLGQVGVITKVTLPLVAAPTAVRRFQLRYRELATMLRDARLATGDHRFDVVRGRSCRRRVADSTSGWTWRSTWTGARRTTGRCSPACPTNQTSGSRRRSPTPITSPDWLPWRRRCEPGGRGSARIRGS
jgi:FAD/FMN-containing dehydrogenase